MPFFLTPEALQAWADSGAPEMTERDYSGMSQEELHGPPPHPRYMCGVDVLEAGVCDYCGEPTGGETDDK